MLVLAVVIAASAPISMMLVGTPVVNLLVSQLIVAVEALIMIMLLSFLPTIAPFLEKMPRIVICFLVGWSYTRFRSLVCCKWPPWLPLPVPLIC